MADVRKILIEIDANTGNVVGGIQSVNKQLTQLGSTAQVTTNQVNKAAKAMQTNLAGSAGIAGAAATELGRTISDLPFGLTAVTNNISQLGNMFALLVTSADGVGNALKAMRTALMGPVGLLIAFQAAVAGLELFAQAQRKAKKDTDDLKKSIDEINESFTEQQSILEALGRAAIYSPEAREALARNMKEVKEFLEAAETVGEVTTDVIDEAVRLGMALLEARRNAAIEQQEYLKLIKDETATETERIQAGTDLADALAAVEAAEKALNLQKQESIELTTKLTKKEEERVELLLKEVGTTFDQLAEGRKILLDLGFDFKTAEDLLIKAGESAVDELQERVESEGERNLFVDLFGLSPEKFQETTERVQQGLNAAFDLINAQFERELALEETKTIALNDQLRERLRNEELTAEARDKINQEIAKNDAELVEKQNEIEKKRFQLNKAQGVANAIVNTALGVSKALSTANIPLATFIGALGAAQVATIMAQTFTPKAMPSPNLTAQGSATQGGLSPAFNVVGATGQNQIAAAVSAAIRETPVRSYVVSSDVTTAQQLDRSIIQGASI